MRTLSCNINDNYSNMIKAKNALILLSELNEQVAVNNDDGRADKKLQQMIERKERKILVNMAMESTLLHS